MLISHGSRTRRRDSDGSRCKSAQSSYNRASQPGVAQQHVYEGSTLNAQSPWQSGYPRRASDASRSHLHHALADSDQVSLGSLGDESLELTTSHSQSVGGVLALLDLMGDRELEQAIDAIERQELESVVQFPSSFRIICIGEASAADKKSLLNTFLSSLAIRLSGSFPLLEQRYHVTRMPDGENEEKSQCFQDHGLSVILTDLMANSVESTERYIKRQCGLSADDRPLAALFPSSSSSSPSSPDTGFDGFVYPDKTPNGIDLCIYFHDNRYCEDDFRVLQILAEYGISFIPILTNPSSSTIDLPSRRARLAAVLAQHKLVGMDLCHFDIETPSFMRRLKRSQAGESTTASRIASHTPYQILTVDQFTALDPMTVYDILKHVRKKGIEHENLQSQKLGLPHGTVRSSDPLPWSKHRPMGGKAKAGRRDVDDDSNEDDDALDNEQLNPSRFAVMIIMVAMMASVMGVWWVWFMQPRSSTAHWSVSLSLGMPTTNGLSLFVDVQHGGEQRWSPYAPVIVVHGQEVKLEEDEDEDGTYREGRYKTTIALPECDSEEPAREIIVQPMSWIDTVYGSPLFLSSNVCRPGLKRPKTASTIRPKTNRKKQYPPSPRYSLWSQLSGLKKSVNYCLSHGSRIIETIIHGESMPVHVSNGP